MKSIKDQKSILYKAAKAIEKDKLIEPGDTVVVACSGGPDSICLLTLLYELKDQQSFSLEACHFNHKLRGEDGDSDEQFVKKYCKDMGIPLTVGERAASETVKNEEDAREIRYSFFEKILEQKGREGTKIALAHHLDDLAETLLMRLIRGSGFKGLSSILPRRKNFIRPLLQISKNEIISFLDTRGIAFCKDSTNSQDIFFRNQIRNQLVPLLKSYNPRVIESLSRTAGNASEIYDYLSSETELLAKSMVNYDRGQYIVDRAALLSLHPVLRKELLLNCIEKLGGKDYTAVQIENIMELIEQNVGKKSLPLPHSLRFEFKNGKIYLYNSEFISFEEHNGKSQKK